MWCEWGKPGENRTFEYIHLIWKTRLMNFTLQILLNKKTVSTIARIIRNTTFSSKTTCWFIACLRDAFAVCVCEVHIWQNHFILTLLWRYFSQLVCSLVLFIQLQFFGKTIWEGMERKFFYSCPRSIFSLMKLCIMRTELITLDYGYNLPHQTIQFAFYMSSELCCCIDTQYFPHSIRVRGLRQISVIFCAPALVFVWVSKNIANSNKYYWQLLFRFGLTLISNKN